MPFRLPATLAVRGARAFAPRDAARRLRASLPAFGRRFAHFWVVWSALLLIHETGHAVAARHEGLSARRVTVGVGPVLDRERFGGTEFVLRLLPLAGVTDVAGPDGRALGSGVVASSARWLDWDREALMLAGGSLATLALAAALAGLVLARERGSGARFVWGRLLVADAVVLTVFNFLPVPPLDGGRAVVGAFVAWSGVPLSTQTHFWVQVGGLALAVVPMTLWTRWTARIDAAALRWGAPPPTPTTER